MPEIVFSTGLVEIPVNGIRNITINPSDLGFLDTIYGMLAKIDSIDREARKKVEKVDDPSKIFDHMRLSDKRMRETVDAVFGEGFCDDIFKGIRLTALADGLTVIENFAFAVIDQMDEDIKQNMAKRNDRISHYTAKYEKYLTK